MEIKKFGTIYLDGWPYKPGTQYDGEVLSIRDSVPDRSIPFVKWKNLWVASQCACFNTTWLALDHFDFIYGHPVKIDGKSYLCRSLKVGSEDGVPNEWDNIIDEFGEDNELCNWKESAFWGQEHITQNGKPIPYIYASRGFSSARSWYNGPPDEKEPFIGFRPVLEPLPRGVKVSRSLTGSTVRVYGPVGSLYGRLLDYNEYDLFLESPDGDNLPSDFNWAITDGPRITIDRSSVVWMRKWAC